MTGGRCDAGFLATRWPSRRIEAAHRPGGELRRCGRLDAPRRLHVAGGRCALGFRGGGAHLSLGLSEPAGVHCCRRRARTPPSRRQRQLAQPAVVGRTLRRRQRPALLRAASPLRRPTGLRARDSAAQRLPRPVLPGCLGRARMGVRGVVHAMDVPRLGRGSVPGQRQRRRAQLPQRDGGLPAADGREERHRRRSTTAGRRAVPLQQQSGRPHRDRRLVVSRQRGQRLREGHHGERPAGRQRLGSPQRLALGGVGRHAWRPGDRMAAQS